MAFILWIIAAILVISGIFALFRKQLLWGIVLDGTRRCTKVGRDTTISGMAAECTARAAKSPQKLSIHHSGRKVMPSRTMPHSRMRP